MCPANSCAPLLSLPHLLPTAPHRTPRAPHRTFTDPPAALPLRCVCDWKGTWPDDDAKGFANWDLASLGIDETHDKKGKVPEIAMAPSAPPVSPGEAFVQPISLGAPSPPPIVCARPASWCGYPGATNEPAYCGEDNVPG